MTLSLEDVISRRRTVSPSEIISTEPEYTPAKPKPGLSLDEWREHFRRNYLRELHRSRVRLRAGWTESAANAWLETASDLLLFASINSRKVSERAHS